MDAASALTLLARLQELAGDGELSGRGDLVPEVLELKAFSEYQCKLDRDEYSHAFAAAAQAYFLVSGTGLPAFEVTTYRRVIEHSSLAIAAIGEAAYGTTLSPSLH